MKNKLHKYYKFYEKNAFKIILLVLMYVGSYFFAHLPYINTFTISYTFLPSLIGGIFLFVLFPLTKEHAFYIFSIVVVIGSIASLLQLSFLLNIIGDLMFIALSIFIFLSLKEGKKEPWN